MYPDKVTRNKLKNICSLCKGHCWVFPFVHIEVLACCNSYELYNWDWQGILKALYCCHTIVVLLSSSELLQSACFLSGTLSFDSSSSHCKYRPPHGKWGALHFFLCVCVHLSNSELSVVEVYCGKMKNDKLPKHVAGFYMDFLLSTNFTFQENYFIQHMIF